MKKILLALVMLLPLTGCGAPESSTLRVSAAASLTDVFTGLGKDFEADHPGVKVEFDFGPSSGLAEGIKAGSPADLFASASTSTMADLVSAGRVSAPVDFATNTMIVALPADNPAHIKSLADLTKPGVKLAVCGEDVPCGKAAAELFAKNKLTLTPITREVDVRGVLTKVSLGEVDAGITYVTDVEAVQAQGKVIGLSIPAAQNASTTYPIAVVADDGADAKAHNQLASDFLALVTGPTGQKALRAAGFGAA